MGFAGGLEHIDEEESLSLAKKHYATRFYFGALEWSAAVVSRNPLNLEAYVLFYEALDKLRAPGKLKKITKLSGIEKLYPLRWITCLYEWQINKYLLQSVLVPYTLGKIQFDESKEALLQSILRVVQDLDGR